jgi:hypothetical protein
MSSKDKGNQRVSPKDNEAKKPISSKQAKEARRAKKAAKAARR